MDILRMLRSRGEPADTDPYEDAIADEYADVPVDERAEELPPAYSPMGPAVLVRAEPRAYRDVGDIVDRLRQGQPVVVSLEQMDNAEAQRIRDFLKGAVYALDGDMRRVASRVFVCLPRSMRYEKLAARADQPPPHAAAMPHEAAGMEENVASASADEVYEPEQLTQ